MTTDRTVTLDVLDGEGCRERWQFHCTRHEDRFCVKAQGPGGAERTGVGADWLDALRELRLVLEDEGLRPLCVGAMVNAHQSGMLAGSSEGAVVYLLSRKRSPTPGETAWIFDPAGPEVTGTVAEQEAFFARWAAGRHRYGPVRAVRGQVRELWHRLRYR